MAVKRGFRGKLKGLMQMTTEYSKMDEAANNLLQAFNENVDQTMYDDLAGDGAYFNAQDALYDLIDTIRDYKDLAEQNPDHRLTNEQERDFRTAINSITNSDEFSDIQMYIGDMDLKGNTNPFMNGEYEDKAPLYFNDNVPRNNQELQRAMSIISEELKRDWQAGNFFNDIIKKSNLYESMNQFSDAVENFENRPVAEIAAAPAPTPTPTRSHSQSHSTQMSFNNPGVTVGSVQATGPRSHVSIGDNATITYEAENYTYNHNNTGSVKITDGQGNTNGSNSNNSINSNNSNVLTV